MLVRSEDSDDPREWLRYARANLAYAEAGRAAGILVEYLCFDAQQAAEKALKGVLLSRGVHFRKLHDLGELLRLVEDAGLAPPAPVADAGSLSPFATQARYPGWGESLDEEDLEKALSLAGAVVDWAAQIIEASPPSE